MKLLIIGGNGMAGHLFVRYFQQAAGTDGMEVVNTTRTGDAAGRSLKLDATDASAVAALVRQVKPDVILNAVGVLNQDAESHPLTAYQVNGLLPHWLRHVADSIGARVIHVSSDCVFSGMRGKYTEDDVPDGTSVYAKSKALGEHRGDGGVGGGGGHLTIRTSIIGPEIRQGGIGLLKWFLEQQGTVSGYARVYWNGVTTLELAKAAAYAMSHPEIGGLVNLTAAETVSKLELLRLFQDAFKLDGVSIVSDDRIILDRTLVSTRSDWGYQSQGYVPMLAELAAWMKQG
ncbi:SDR family oxidoreductase [Paenibacillus sp. OV219]|uniref:dTDP-4-dehydrorhamnose reductase family protein n=1 Tax=Paenibacillus sp. OV219 TaxID=1884377 RepID=UPI0008B5BD79|nr:SDR family oxidoreductase [Paenibacillus sp. OV219]SEN75372.1 dTDP-4-dehydrorhamnose reductase [Paenibacillus sp. OV219]